MFVTHSRWQPLSESTLPHCEFRVWDPPLTAGHCKPAQPGIPVVTEWGRGLEFGSRTPSPGE